MTKPEISVIIPVYKVEKYLECCLESVLNQSFKNFEAILIDDGSPDTCPQICDRYASLDSRFIVVHKKNGGLASARNVGLDVCCGNYICFVDSDDYIELNFLESLYEQIYKGDFDFVSCVANFVDENNGFLKQNGYAAERKIISENIFETYFYTNFIEDATWNKIYRRELFDDLRFKERIIFEDSEIIVRILKKCKKVLFIRLFLYNYRIREESILNYQKGNIDGQSQMFSLKKLDLMHVYYSNAIELADTMWSQIYYKRLISVCADYSIKITGLNNSKKYRQIILSYYRKATQIYSLKNFNMKVRICIYLQIRMPIFWIIIKKLFR